MAAKKKVVKKAAAKAPGKYSDLIPDQALKDLMKKYGVEALIVVSLKNGNGATNAEGVSPGNAEAFVKMLNTVSGRLDLVSKARGIVGMLEKLVGNLQENKKKPVAKKKR